MLLLLKNAIEQNSIKDANLYFISEIKYKFVSLIFLSIL